MKKAIIIFPHLLEYYLILDFYMRYIWWFRIGEGYIYFFFFDCIVWSSKYPQKLNFGFL
jgi:hypothetical protein